MWRRRFFLYNADKASGVVSPAIITSIIARPDSPSTLLATEDGVNHLLLPIAQVWMKGESADVSDIKVGERVMIWFAGNEVGPEKIVTKVVIGNKIVQLTDTIV